MASRGLARSGTSPGPGLPTSGSHSVWLTSTVMARHVGADHERGDSAVPSLKEGDVLVDRDESPSLRSLGS